MLIQFFANGKGGGAAPVGYLTATEVLAYDDNRDLRRDGRDALAQLDEAVKGHRQRHQGSPFFGPDISDRARPRPMRRAFPQLQTMLFQPDIQRGEVCEVRHSMKQLVTGVPHVLLDLPFLPTRCRIVELGLEDVVVRHGEEAHVDLSFLAAADTIHCRLRSARPRTHGGPASLS